MDRKASVVVGLLGRRVIAAAGVALCLALPASAAAQAGAQIAGVVRDTTGGVLPGVTVEAASPALIERVRSVVTDDVGQYRLLDLRPGTYTVTFTLPGFATVRREGVELTTNFTATVNADLQVGDVAETITVSGQTPVVDVQNVTQQRTLTRDVLEAVPTGKYYQNYAVLTPGIIVRANVTNSNQDVGGSLGNVSAQMAIHGSRTRDQQILLDGMNVTSAHVNSVSSFNPQDGNVEEFTILAGSNPAEAETGGVRINLVPRDGSNQLRGAFFVNGMNRSLQADNMDDDLRTRGLRAPNKVKLQYDIATTLGGPIAPDKVWFFGAYRYFKNDRDVGGVFYNSDPKARVFVPDQSKPGVQDTSTWDGNGRVTWQVSPRNKVNGFFDYNYQCDCHRYISAAVAPEASMYLQFRNKIAQTSWSSPLSNRTLVEAGVSLLWWADTRELQPEATEISITEQSNNLTFRSPTGATNHSNWPGHTLNYRVSLSQVTGSHTFKVGFSSLTHDLKQEAKGPIGDVTYRTLNGVPNLVTYYATPYQWSGANDPNIGLFAQDQWTLNRLTLNYGLRFDWLRSSYDGQDLPATRWMAARSFQGADVSNWKDLNPRISASYDLFGDGKTAVKGSINRYVTQQGLLDHILPVEAVNASNNVSARAWNDLNGDFVVQGDPFSSVANGELGPQTNLNFGRTVRTFFSDPELDNGWHKRPYNWEASFGVQHELVPRVSLTAMYFRRWFGNFIVTQNSAVTAADYDSYCITVPNDARLPSAGSQVCGNYDIKPTALGRIRTFRTSANNFGDQEETWQGVDLLLNARLLNGAFLQGGVSTGRTVADDCAIRKNHPNVTTTNGYTLAEGLYSGNTWSGAPPTDFCRIETPWLTTFRLVGAYPMPYGIQLSGSLQNNYGAPLYANYVATNAVIAPRLGRNLAGAPSATFNIVEPGSLYYDRLTQVDVRVSKEFPIGGTARLKAMLDLYNALNGNTVIASNMTYAGTGAAWNTPQVILVGRIIKFGGQISF
ncbi:MAG: TonB-dependent receptor [Acidimicrobiia bacterium]|nr:TonB-dependent receptor [Acidimicrobiia bacterium]